jgi:alpha 1,2-mannosyltransferase
VHQLLLAMTSFEDRWNSKYNYDYVFLNEVQLPVQRRLVSNHRQEPFADDFKQLTAAATRSRCQYGLVPKEHWEEPAWIDQQKAQHVRETATYMYGGCPCFKRVLDLELLFLGDSQSYRRMCRYQASSAGRSTCC